MRHFSRLANVGHHPGERPTRADLLAALEEARAALQRAGENFMAMRLSETPASLACSEGMADALDAINRVDVEQPREKSPAEVRADEIDAEAGTQLRPLTFEDAIRFAREAREDITRALNDASREGRRLDAAAWLLVAQRLLARE